MGAQSTVRRTPGRAGRLLNMASCPVEDSPIGSCTPPIPASTSNCSLRCSPKPRLPFLHLRPIFRNRPIHKLLAKTALTSLFLASFRFRTASELYFGN